MPGHRVAHYTQTKKSKFCHRDSPLKLQKITGSLSGEKSIKFVDYARACGITNFISSVDMGHDEHVVEHGKQGVCDENALLKAIAPSLSIRT
jgi:hypothetical protein